MENMIRKIDLRIGCWISDIHASDKGMWQVKELRATKCKYGQFISKYEDLRPIPLTPEILEKCGWAWNKECDSFELPGKVTMNLQFSDISGSYTMFNYVLKAVTAKRIFYLHQLQNLYYALTGTELEINL